MNAASALIPIRVRLATRRFPLLHQPLRWLNRVALPALVKWLYHIPRIFIPRSWTIGLPKGVFSNFERLANPMNLHNGRIVVTDQGSPNLPSPSIMVLCKRKQHLEQPWPIFWARHDNARLVGPSLAHLDGKKQICLEAAYGPRRVNDDPAYHHFAFGSPVRLAGPWTSIVSRFSSNDQPQPYAHWLLDALPRLALLNEFPADTRVIVPPHRLAYQTQSLALLGLVDRCRWTSERHLLLEEYFFSAPTSMVVCYNPYAVNFLRSRFLPLALNTSTLPTRFFVRRKGQARNIVNEAEVLDFFQRQGWAIIDPGQMGFLEQIQLFAGAEAICAIHGSATANIVWCSHGCKVLELFADCYLAGDQEWIAQCVGADYRFLLFPSDHKLNAQVDLSTLKEHLRAMCLS
jgi:capsular polysaccharide biosynthesis protein